MAQEQKHSRVYTDRPPYADYDAPAKFQAIESIIAKRLREHPNAICSYSGGSDSDIMIDLLERTRKVFHLPPIKYVFFNTGLEMKATKDHVKDTAEKYGVEIEEIRPKVNIVKATREHGVPFMSKVCSANLSKWQKAEFPLTIVDEFERAVDKLETLTDLKQRYPHCSKEIEYFCSCNRNGEMWKGSQFAISNNKYMVDFLKKIPPQFAISSVCCEYCKKRPAHEAQKGFDMIITGERQAEGGQRAAGSNKSCFSEMSNGQYKLRPLYYVTDKDKAWYKEYYGVCYSDAYEVYGLTRTGCCGCPISYKATEDLAKIEPYEPNVVKAAYNIFGKSYEYRAKYNEYKKMRMEADKRGGQVSLFEGGNT